MNKIDVDFQFMLAVDFVSTFLAIKTFVNKRIYQNILN